MGFFFWPAVSFLINEGAARLFIGFDFGGSFRSSCCFQAQKTAMNRFAAFAVVASACLSGLHGQELNPEKKTSATPPPGSVKGAAEAAVQSASTEKIQKPPKKILIGGASVDLFRPSEKSSSAQSAGKVRGWQLLNPFAPLDKASKSSRAWDGRRSYRKKFKEPKTAETEGIVLFFIKF